MPCEMKFGKEATTMARRLTSGCINARAIGLSGRSYYSFIKVCFADLYFAWLNEADRKEAPEDNF